MDSRDILSATNTSKRLIQDENYYKYIFKKTERIVSVTFYILHNVPDSATSRMHIEDIQHAARSVHDAILQSLESRAYAAEDIVRGVAHALITLESKLSVAQVSGVIAPEVLHVLRNEVDSVIRGLNRYIGDDSEALMFETTPAPNQTLERRAPARTPQRPAHTPQQSTATPDRRERIKTILEAKGQATIKDISEIITDVSEKTIQRELNAMIEDNVVKREGERRWSKYSLF